MNRRVLIVEDDADTSKAISIRLRSAGYEVFLASDGASALLEAQRQNPDAILLDLGLPGGDGLVVLRRLKKLTALSKVPVIVLTARDPGTTREPAMEAGAAAYLSKPVEPEALLAELAKLWPAGPSGGASPERVLVIEDDHDTRKGLNIRLRAEGFQVSEAADSLSAISVAARERPDVILLDLGLPGGDGFVVLDRLKTRADLASVPVIVLSARDPASYEQRALSGGAVAFLQKPVANAALLATIRRALDVPEGS